MNKLKMLFTQASFISVGIFLSVGIAQVICHLMDDVYAPEWYFTLSVILAGIICSLLSLLLCVENFKTYLIAVHFGILFIAVSLLGFLFKWYTNLVGYFIVMGIFVCVYVFTWFAMLWIYKKDDKAINSALDSIRDEE